MFLGVARRGADVLAAMSWGSDAKLAGVTATTAAIIAPARNSLVTRVTLLSFLPVQPA
jgi:hypothetical protein